MTELPALPADAARYLHELCHELRALRSTDRRDILREVECHLRESGTLSGALQGLGSPASLAQRYLAMVPAAAPRAWSPMLDELLHGARQLGQVVWRLGLSAAGYAVGGCLLAAAMLKPFRPDHAGLWHAPGSDSYSLHLGLGEAIGPGQELLGWWLVPLGWVVGALALRAATRVLRRAFQTPGASA